MRPWNRLSMRRKKKRKSSLRTLKASENTSRYRRTWPVTRSNYSRNSRCRSIKRYRSNSNYQKRTSSWVYCRREKVWCRCWKQRNKSMQLYKQTTYKWVKMLDPRLKYRHRLTSSVDSFKTLFLSSLITSCSQKSHVFITGTKRIVMCISMSWLRNKQ